MFVYLFESKHVSMHFLLIKGWQQVVCTHDTGPKSFNESLFKYLPAENVHTVILWKTSSQQTSVLGGKTRASFKPKKIVYVKCTIQEHIKISVTR
jgi:hypothetical protein